MWCLLLANWKFWRTRKGVTDTLPFTPMGFLRSVSIVEPHIGVYINRIGTMEAAARITWHRICGRTDNTFENIYAIWVITKEYKDRPWLWNVYTFNECYVFLYSIIKFFLHYYSVLLPSQYSGDKYTSQALLSPNVPFELQQTQF